MGPDPPARRTSKKHSESSLKEAEGDCGDVRGTKGLKSPLSHRYLSSLHLSPLLSRIRTLLEHVSISRSELKGRELEENLELILEAKDDILERVVSPPPKSPLPSIHSPPANSLSSSRSLQGRSLEEAPELFQRTEMVVVKGAGSGGPCRPSGSCSWGKRKGGAEGRGGEFRDTTVPAKTPIIPLPAGGTQRLIKRPTLRRVREEAELKFSAPASNSLRPLLLQLTFKPSSQTQSNHSQSSRVHARKGRVVSTQTPLPPSTSFTSSPPSPPHLRASGGGGAESVGLSGSSPRPHTRPSSSSPLGQS